MDGILKCDHSNESFSGALYYCMFYFPVDYKIDIYVLELFGFCIFRGLKSLKHVKERRICVKTVASCPCIFSLIFVSTLSDNNGIAAEAAIELKNNPGGRAMRVKRQHSILQFLKIT